MTIDERIAKRKAEGWRHIGFHVRDKRTGELYAPCGRKTFETEQAFLYAPTFDTSKAKPWQRIVPVFTRTIRTKRGHSFSWALARMKEGRWVRISLWPKAAKIRLHNEWITTENPQKDFQPQVCHIMSMEWELAE